MGYLNENQKVGNQCQTINRKHVHGSRVATIEIGKESNL